MKPVALFAGGFHLIFGGLMFLGFVLRLDRNTGDPGWMTLGFLIFLGLLPLFCAILIFRSRFLLSCITGCLLIEIGASLSFGFLLVRYHGSVHPWPADIAALVLAGLFPLLSGVMMLQRRYELIEKVMKYICGAGFALFALCAASFFLLPPRISDPLNIPAIGGLVGALLAGAVWISARFASRAETRRSTRREMARSA